jgi:hypothetical protein
MKIKEKPCSKLKEKRCRLGGVVVLHQERELFSQAYAARIISDIMPDE